MSCYGLRFPELARSLADAGAQLLLCASSGCRGPMSRSRRIGRITSTSQAEDRAGSFGNKSPEPHTRGRFLRFLVDF